MINLRNTLLQFTSANLKIFEVDSKFNEEGGGVFVLGPLRLNLTDSDKFN